MLGEHYAVGGLDIFPKPVQRPHPPLLIGGGKRRLLTLAGREADIVGLLTTSVATGTVVDDPRERTVSAVQQKLGWIRDGAGERFDQIELSLIPTLIVTADRLSTAEHLIAERGWDGMTGDDVLSMPSLLIGSLDEICATLCRRRDEFGFSYYIISDQIAEEFAPVVCRLSGR